MLLKRNLYHQVARYSKSAKKAFKVAVVGAAGGIGQPLSLLLKLNPRVAQLALHDKVDKVEMKGIVADLSHMCTTADVTAYLGEEELQCALDGADVVVVPAGMPRKPGMTRADLLTVNGDVAVLVAETVSKVCPKALVCFITNPINTLLPIAAEIMKQQNCFDPKRLFGVTTLDVVRSKTFLGAVLGVNPQKVRIPVIGGHAGTTILPIISQCKPKYTCSDEDRAKLVHRIQEGGTEVLEAKAGKGSATLSMAYAAANFVDSLLRGLSGEKNIVECSYVHSNVTEAEYFSSPLLLGPSGIQRNLGLPKLDETELKQVCALIELLKKDIEEGMKFMCERKNKK